MLLSEMQVIVARIEKIRDMSYEEKQQQVLVQYETKQSKLNDKFV